VPLTRASGRSIGFVVDVDGTTKYDPLSDVLWQERSLLSRLVFKLAVVRILLAAEGYEWLPLAADEAAGIIEELEVVGGWRRGLLGEHEPLTLVDVAGAAPAPWDDILHEHRESLLALRDEARRGASSTVAALLATRALVAVEVEELEMHGDGLGAEVLRLACEHLHEIADRAVCLVPDDDSR
jgi:hypothetical protein